MTPRIAIVTGAGRGLGRTMALGLLKHGLTVVAVDRDREPLSEVASLAGDDASRLLTFAQDLTASAAAENVEQFVMQKHGRIDILVNNAGIRSRKAFEQFTHEDFDRVVAVNLRAPFFASQAVIPIMRRQGGGVIVNMASQLGIVASRFGAISSASRRSMSPSSMWLRRLIVKSCMPSRNDFLMWSASR